MSCPYKGQGREVGVYSDLEGPLSCTPALTSELRPLISRTMAGSATIIASLLLLVACMGYIFPTDSATIPSSCCISFVSKKIPGHRLVSYQLANGSVCPKAGVIFITKKGHKFCGDPKLLWVQRHIKNLDAKRKQSSAHAKALDTKFSIQRHRGNSTEV
ncbi:C-C motif chemokine 24 [Lemmus lemmus]